MKIIWKAALFITGLSLLAGVTGCSGGGEKSITAFVGSASKPAMEEAAEAFREKTGITVYLNFGGSGTVLSQMKIDESGDLYIPGSPDYMEMAEADGDIDPATVKVISYLVPAILVPAGNPAGIKSLTDLARPGVTVGIGDPETVCVGLYAYEVMEYNNVMADIVPNIVTHTESCSKTATLVALGSIDAVIGWRVFSKWHDTVDVVYLEANQVPRLAYIPGAVSTYTKDEKSARAFLDFLVSEEGQAIFAKWGYISTEEEARTFAPDAQIGGEYRLPDDYEPPVQ